MATIGSYNDPYHVSSNRINDGDGQQWVHLECWKKLANPTRYTSVEHQYMEVLADQAQHDAAVIQVANEMIGRHGGPV